MSVTVSNSILSKVQLQSRLCTLCCSLGDS